jgi:hypothetical protein
LQPDNIYRTILSCPLIIIPFILWDYDQINTFFGFPTNQYAFPIFPGYPPTVWGCFYAGVTTNTLIPEKLDAHH